MEALSERLDWRSEEEFARISNRRNIHPRREKEIRLGKKESPVGSLQPDLMVLNVGRLRFGEVGAIEDSRLLARLFPITCAVEWLHVQHEGHVAGTAGLRLRLQGTRTGRRWLLALEA